MRALVTGATGFVGSHLVRALLQRGHTVRILARSADKAAPLRTAGAEVCIGDLGVPASLDGIAADMDAVFHLGSVVHGATQDFDRVDVRGTERLLSESRRAGVRRYVYASTLAGYPPVAAASVIDEQTPLDLTGRLGNYARTKARCERMILDFGGQPECVIVRLGFVCGGDANVFPQHVCKFISRKLVILFGDGGISLPLTLIDNAVDALLLGAAVPGIAGEIFNIVDDDVITQRDYLALLRKCAGGKPHVLRLPLSAYYAIGLASELGAIATRGEPETTRYRIGSRSARVHWDCSKAKRVLHWEPRMPLQEGLALAFRTYARRAETQGRL